MDANNESKRGSAIAAALMIAVGVGLVVGTTTNLATTERRLNRNAELMAEARNAAESVVEFGFSELSHRFDSNMAFPSDSLAPKQGSDPLKLPSGFYDLYTDAAGSPAASNVKMPSDPYDPMKPWGTYDTELIGGVVPPGEWKFIDANTPGNEFDPMRGMKAFIRDVKVYGRATVEGPFGNILTAYCSQELQVRDGPLFAYAVFYNMDMEIAPGPQMDITGAVHANGDMYIQSNALLNFHKQVTATGNVYHGPASGFGKSLANGTVNFVNGSGRLISMQDAGGRWIDSTYSNWRSVASNRWDGNLQDASHGIQKHNPVALKPYVRDDPTTSTRDDDLNYGYQLIQPLNTSGGADMNIEQQKFAAHAGIVINVHDNGSHDAITYVSVYAQKHDVEGHLVYDGNNPEYVPLANNFVRVENYDPPEYNNGPVKGGLYDRRQGMGQNLVVVDMGKLRDLIRANQEGDWGSGNEAKPSSWWNGVVYVRFPQKATSPGKDGVVPGYKGFAVQLVNAQSGGGKSGIPNPSGKGDDYGWSGAPLGTTVATNGQMYVLGNYNADGSTYTGSSTATDNEQEPPAALAADSITILSTNWDNADSATSSTSYRKAKPTEVAAAILTGLAPSDKNNNNAYSGGVENFPRFLENWSGVTFTYRGSLVDLFESEVGTEPWGKSNVYDAPIRNWGFDELFAEGSYPPGTPNTRTYRRINFRNLSQDEWTADLEELKKNLGI